MYTRSLNLLIHSFQCSQVAQYVLPGFLSFRNNCDHNFHRFIYDMSGWKSYLLITFIFLIRVFSILVLDLAKLDELD